MVDCRALTGIKLLEGSIPVRLKRPIVLLLSKVLTNFKRWIIIAAMQRVVNTQHGAIFAIVDQHGYHPTVGIISTHIRAPLQWCKSSATSLTMTSCDTRSQSIHQYISVLQMLLSASVTLCPEIQPAFPYQKAVSNIGTHIGLSSIAHGRPAIPDTGRCTTFTAFGTSHDPVSGLENTLASYLIDAVKCVLTLRDDTSLKHLIAPSALVHACHTEVKSHYLQLTASVNADHCYREPASKRVPCFALLGGKISPPHLHLPFFQQQVPDDGEPKKLHPLYSLTPTDFMTATISFTSAISSIDGESLLDKEHTTQVDPVSFTSAISGIDGESLLDKEHTTQADPVSFTSAIAGIDGESLLEKDFIIVPSHVYHELAKVKGNTGLWHCQHSAIQALLACDSLADKDLDTCIVFEEEITFVAFADDIDLTNDDIPFQDDLYPFWHAVVPPS